MRKPEPIKAFAADQLTEEGAKEILNALEILLNYKCSFILLGTTFGSKSPYDFSMIASNGTYGDLLHGLIMRNEETQGKEAFEIINRINDFRKLCTALIDEILTREEKRQGIRP